MYPLYVGACIHIQVVYGRKAIVVVNIMVFLLGHLPFKARRALCLNWAHRTNNTDIIETWASIDRLRLMNRKLDRLGLGRR